ncbi:MAG: hypothetical protein NTX64_16220 [Elusimicrobia bacterium]|nr:hypothetical protein [Elusimicrobiota bacterium]
MLVPPEFPRLSPPPLGPDGRPLRARQLKPEDFDRLRPPESEAGYKRWANDAHRGPPHWHAGAAADYHHDAQRWGALLGAERWAWIVRSGGNWWTWAEQTPVVWHAERWWCFKNDSWFLLHDGQAWAYRFFADLRRDGLFEPRTRIRVVYSEDARRAAISLPGQDTVVYDVESGREVGRLPEREPAREKAKAPRL